MTNKYAMKLTEADARRLDQEDPLKHTRDAFHIGEENLIYLDGNSLGRAPVQAKSKLEDVIQRQWSQRLIRYWNEGWYTRSLDLGNKLAPIAGASEGEIVVADSTSVNLYKLGHAALKHQQGRKKIITDNLNFPSDVYILQGLVEQFGPGYELEILESRDGMTIGLDQLEAALDGNTALVSLSHVVFKSAFRYPMVEVTRMVQDAGALMLWDLSHSIGAVPGELNRANADLAIGCSYKYLNGGPGSLAFLYVRQDLQDKLVSPIWGWFGESDPFEFGLDYRPAQGIKRFFAGTPPIMAMESMEFTLDMLNQEGMDRVREKSLKQTGFLLELAEEYLYQLGYFIGSPREEELRGSHISLKHPEAYRICKALIDPATGSHVVIPDFREPDNIRLGITPLYTTYLEIYQAVGMLKAIAEERWYERFSNERADVT